MARNRRQKAAKAKRARRIAERTVDNALRRGLAASQIHDQSSPPPEKVRQQTMLERYLAHGDKGGITQRQYWAGLRLYEDWRNMGQDFVQAAALTERVADNGYANPTLRQVECHRRYAAAMEALGPPRSSLVVHVCLYDYPAGDWADRYGNCSTGKAMDMLRDGLDALDRHYADARKAEREREMEVA